MAAKRTIVDEILKYTIIVNGDQSQKELYEVENATRKLTQRNKELREEKKRLAAENKKDTAQYKAITQELRKNNTAIRANKNRMAELRKQIGLTGLTMAQLSQEAKRLKLAMHNMTPGSADYIKHQKQLRAVNARLAELREGARNSGNAFQRMADKFNRFQALAFATIAALSALVVAFQKFTDYTGKLSDAQSDVVKTTGLTREAVNKLTAELGLFKTRSARIELLQLAEEAGRLGKTSTKDILDFVKTADQIKVALGDDLNGDINENVRIIGKLAEQYRVGAEWGAEFGQSMDMIGSAINEVAASGAAQAGYLVDYTSRLVGVSRQAGIAAQEQIGFAAVLDESGQRVETSATAVSQAIVGMFKDTETYAAIAGIETEKFSQLLQTDANEAFLRFLKGLNGNNEGLAQLAAKFDQLGIDGTRAISILATLSSQTEKIREKQDLANSSLNEAISLQKEFNEKNSNFAAVLDKIRKRIAAIIVDNTLAEWIKSAVTGFGVLIGAVEDADHAANRWRETIITLGKMIVVATTAIISYKAALQLAYLWTNRNVQATLLYRTAQKVATVTTNALKGATLLFSAAQLALTGNIKRATAALRLFMMVTKLSPVGLLVGAISALTAAYFLLRDSVDQATAAQRVFNDVNATAEKNLAKEQATLTRLLAIAKDENVSRKNRLQAVKDLNALSPEYLGNIKLEEVGYLSTKTAIDSYLESLRQKAREEASYQKRVELNKQLIEEQNKALSEEAKWYDNLLAGALGPNGISFGLEKQIERRLENVKAINDEIKALDNYDAELRKNSQNEQKDYVPTQGDILTRNILQTGEFNAERAKAEAEAQKAIEEAAKKRKEAIQKGYDDIRKVIEQENIKLADAKIKDPFLLDSAQLDREFAAYFEKAKGNEELILQLKDIYFQRQLALVEKHLKTEQQFYQDFALDRTLFEENPDQDFAFGPNAKPLDENELRQSYRLAADLRLAHNQIMAEYYASDFETFKEFEKAKQDSIKATIDAQKQAQQQLQSNVQSFAQGFTTMGRSLDNLMRLEIERIEIVQRAGESEEMFTKRKSKEEEKRKEIEKKYAGIRLMTTIGEIVAQTALAVMKAAPIVPLQVLMGALGATQIGLATAEYNKIQGFEEGLYPVMDQKGRKFNANYAHSPGTGKLTQPTILAGEKPEIIIDPITTRHLELNYPEVVQTIYASASRMRGYQSGHYPTANQTTTAAPAPQTDAELKAMMAAMLSTQTQLQETLSSGILAAYDDAQVRKIRERLEINQNVQNTREI